MRRVAHRALFGPKDGAMMTGTPPFNVLADGSAYKEVYGAWLFVGFRCENCGQVGVPREDAGGCRWCGADRMVVS